MNSGDNSGKLLEDRFKEKGYRLTEPRREILSVLRDTAEHLSIEDIYMKVHENYPEIGMATIYRTVDLLLDMNLVNKYDFGDGKSRYELREDKEVEEHHHHLICRKCGRIIDYDDFLNEETELIRKTEEALSRKYDFEIDRHIINFYGLCTECRED